MDFNFIKKNSNNMPKTLKITPYEKNAKKHPKKQLEHLATIVKEIGWRQPVIVNQKGIIVVGHGRYMTWEQFGEKMNLPDIWVMNDKAETVFGEPAKDPLTPAQEKAWRLADNKVAEGDIDMVIVMGELGELTSDLVELAGFGDLDLDINNLDDSFDAPEGEKGEFEHISFSLHNEQADFIRKVLKDLELPDDLKTFGNENKNGNKLYYICKMYQQNK